MGIQGIGFGQIADLFFSFQGALFYRNATDYGLAAILSEIAGDDLHSGGFAGAVRPQESHDLTFIYRERNSIYRLLFAVDFYKPLYFNGHPPGLLSDILGLSQFLQPLHYTLNT